MSASLLWVGVLCQALDVAGSVRVEARAGSAPVVVGADSEPAVAVESTPTGAVRLRSRTSTTTLRYRLRIFYRYPNPLELTRPLFFHQGELSEELRLSRRVTWLTRAEGGYGEADYTAADLLFDPLTAAPVPDDVLLFQRILVGTEVALELDRRHRLRFGPEFEHSGPVTDGEESVLPQTTRFGMQGAHEYRLSLRDTLVSSLQADRYLFSTGDRLTTTRGVAAWQRRLSLRTESELYGGALVARSNTPQDGSGPGRDTVWVPELGGALRSVLWHQPPSALRGSAALTWFGLVNPLLAEVEPRLGLTATLDWQVNEYWSARADAGAFTAATTEPRQFDMATPDAALVQETLVTFATPISYRAARGATIEFGSRGSLRGPHWNADDFALQNLELWFYVALILHAGSDDSQGAWAL